MAHRSGQSGGLRLSGQRVDSRLKLMARWERLAQREAASSAQHEAAKRAADRAAASGVAAKLSGDAS